MSPDILVVPECGQVGALQAELGVQPPSGALWVGSNPVKGLGVFSFGAFTIAPAEFYNPEHKYIFPVEVHGPAEFLLFAVWTLPVEDSYVRPLSAALAEYEPMMRGREVVIAGDFNANVALDIKSKAFPFSEFVCRAEALGLRSLYHESTGERHGKERIPTFFLYHHEEKPLHLDYLFASATLRAWVQDAKVTGAS